VRKQFNKARKTGIGDWERFKESQHIYKKVIVAAKRNSWKTFCENTVGAPEASNLHRILSEETSTHLGCLKFPNGGYTEAMGDTTDHLTKVHFLGFRRSLQGSGEQQRPRERYKPRARGLAAKCFIIVGWNGQLSHSNPTRLLEQMGYIPFQYRRGLIYCSAP